MLQRQIDVLGSEAVLLGPQVTCDGFQRERGIRVQTHVHADHMRDFSTSLSGEVVMTAPTMRLLGEKYPQLEERANVHVVAEGGTWRCGECELRLVSSNHMLGAVQVKVEYPDGLVVGYSGDFNWPLQEVVRVDYLVIDATYGAPDSGRRYTGEMACEALVELVRDGLRSGPVHILADTGVAEYGLRELEGADVLRDVRVIGSKHHAWTAEVHREYRWSVPRVVDSASEEGLAIARDGRYVRLWGRSAAALADGLYDGTVVRLTKYGVVREPFEQEAEKAFRVGLGLHADFQATLEYVEASGAGYVVVDSVRGGRRALDLAGIINAQCDGVTAVVASGRKSMGWGE